MARLLPTDYFHVVFTVPDALLASLAMRNRELFFAAMFKAGGQTLLQLGEDGKRLGAQVGLTAVLHTWTRDLRFHPHLHCIVTGGGLTRDGLRWKASKQDYLFPVSVLSALFRGKMLALLDEAFRDGRLITTGVDGFGGGVSDEVAWRRLKRSAYRTKLGVVREAAVRGARVGLPVPSVGTPTASDSPTIALSLPATKPSPFAPAAMTPRRCTRMSFSAASSCTCCRPAS